MVVLALDTATRQGSAALLVDETCDVSAGDPARTHGERLPRELLDLLTARGLTLADVDRFAVVSGPGSFTGLRVGIAAIQGLALVTGHTVAPVTTIEAMAEGWRLAVPGGGSGACPGVAASEASARRSRGPRLIVACLDGQRNDVFFAAWHVASGTPIERGDPVIPPSVGGPEDLVRALASQRGRDQPAVIVGIGLERHEPVLRRLEMPIEAVPLTLAEVAARIAARRPELTTTPHALRPLYVRRPDAVIARERAGLAP